MKSFSITIYFLMCFTLILSGCKEKPEQERECPLEGKWKATSFIANKKVDTNNDGVANSNLKLEDACMDVAYTFNNNGYVKRSGKNSQTNCEFKDLNFLFTMNDSIIAMESQGRITSIHYKLSGCRLTLYNIDGLDRTENGFESFKVTSTYQKIEE